MQNSGFILIEKPAGPTSHDIVDMLRRVTGVKRIGHAGTLDPFAEGLLIVGVGREATRRLDRFKNLPKTYISTLRLGATSDTHDPTGRVTISNIQFPISKRDIENVLPSFVGEIKQTPPMHSAKKIQGQKLYELARRGQTIEREPNRITIYSIKILGLENQKLEIEISCSPGTYIRALARDIGTQLKCGAYCEKLIRTTIGPFCLNKATKLDQITSQNWHQFLMNVNITIENEKKKIKVLVFGTFDCLHPGHLDFFRQAKELGDELIVGIGRDKVVTEIKKRPARQNEMIRLAAVQACTLVEKGLLLPIDPAERFSWIKKINPGIIALGYDQTAFTDHLDADLQKHGIPCKVVRLNAFHPEKYKSSKM